MVDRPPRAITLTDIMEALSLAPHELQAFDPAFPRFDAQRPLLVLQAQFSSARAVLADRYPPQAEARVVSARSTTTAAVTALPTSADAWLLPALAPEHDHRALAGLRGVMERLFAPDGCPWDREQTHESLRRYFLEEAYELVDAIDRGDVRGLEEEIGDVLAHLFMQTALAQEQGAFSLEDVVAYAAAKFVRRHPHVFGDEEAGSYEALLDRWEQIKADERAARGEQPDAAATEGVLASVPTAAPALQRASGLIGRALRARVTEPPASAADALLEQSRAVADAPDADAIGGLLWATVRAAREADVDAEEALRAACARFVTAVDAVEATLRLGEAAPTSVPLRATWLAAARASEAQ